MEFTNSQVSLIRTALVLAESTWKENREMADDEGYVRLAIQFENQVNEANALLEKIDNEEVYND